MTPDVDAEPLDSFERAVLFAIERALARDEADEPPSDPGPEEPG